MKLGRAGVMQWSCSAVDNLGDLFKIQGKSKRHGCHSIVQQHAIPSGVSSAQGQAIISSHVDTGETENIAEGDANRLRTILHKINLNSL